MGPREENKRPDGRSETIPYEWVVKFFIEWLGYILTLWVVNESGEVVNKPGRFLSPFKERSGSFKSRSGHNRLT